MEIPQDGKLLVLSPHLDDAVFGCGELIAHFRDATVLTVLAGAPAGFDELTPWDASSGFVNAQEAIVLRRREDRAALEVLGASPRWLDFCDSQYRHTPSPKDIVQALVETMKQLTPSTVCIPAGLFHSDHELVHEAALSLLQKHDGTAVTWLMYEEPSYRRVPGLLQRRLADLSSRDMRATPVVARGQWEMEPVEAAALKHEAVHCYASQLRALEQTVKEGYIDVFSPERYWLIEPHADSATE